MRDPQAVWTSTRLQQRRTTRPLNHDLVAVIVVCVIFGLQIMAVMLCTGGPEAYSQVASEGMQFQ